MKNKPNFKSNFKDKFILYINYKQSQGYDYVSMTKYIKTIDNYLFDNNIKKLDEENVNKLCMKREKEKVIGTFRRQVFLKNFCLFMVSQGYNNYFVYNKEFIKYEPANIQYIFSKEEIDKLFNHLDNLKYYRSTDIFLKDNMKMLLTLFYCTGIRASEGFNLKYEDVNHFDKTITIKHSKNNITRTLPLTDKTFDLLNKHILKYKKLHKDFIFKTSNGTIYGRWFVQLYKKILDDLEIYVKDKETPRLHDLRFTFAVNALNQMCENNIDIYVALPILQEYMGHQNIKSTEYYLKYTDVEREYINNKMEIFNIDIYGDNNE